MEILHTTIYQPGRSTYHMEANDFLLILEGEGIAQCGNDNVYPVAKGVAFSTIEKTELYKLLSDDIEEESYKIVVEEDNSGIKNYEIQPVNQKVK